MESLNLSGADTRGFEAVDPGSYNAEVAQAEWRETKGGENAKMPAGCPLLAIGFKITDEPVEGQWVWGQWVLPNNEYEKKEKEKAAKMKGMFVRMIMAITGESEEEVTSGDYNLDLDELVGQECVLRVGKYQYPKDSDPPEYQNDVKGVKPAGSPISAGQTGSII